MINNMFVELKEIKYFKETTDFKSLNARLHETPSELKPV